MPAGVVGDERRRVVWFVALGGMVAATAAAAVLVGGRLFPSHTREFRAAVDGTTRIVVRTGGGCGCGAQGPQQTLVEVTAPEEVGKLVAAFDFKYDWGRRCSLEMCGWPTFEFYRGGKRVATVSYLVRGHVRWDDGPWDSDTFLRPESAEFLAGWIEEHGATRKQWEAKQKHSGISEAK